MTNEHIQRAVNSRLPMVKASADTLSKHIYYLKAEMALLELKVLSEEELTIELNKKLEEVKEALAVRTAIDDYLNKYKMPDAKY